MPETHLNKENFANWKAKPSSVAKEISDMPLERDWFIEEPEKETKPVLSMERRRKEKEDFEEYKGRVRKERKRKWGPIACAVALAVGLNAMSSKAHAAEKLVPHHESDNAGQVRSGDDSADETAGGNTGERLVREMIDKGNNYHQVKNFYRMSQIAIAESESLEETLEAGGTAPDVSGQFVEVWKQKKADIIDKLEENGVKYSKDDPEVRDFVDKLTSLSVDNNIDGMNDMITDLTGKMIESAKKISKNSNAESDTQSGQAASPDNLEGPPAPVHNFDKIQSDTDSDWVGARIKFEKEMYVKTAQTLSYYETFNHSTDQNIINKAITASEALKPAVDSLDKLIKNNAPESCIFLFGNIIIDELKNGGEHIKYNNAPREEIKRLIPAEKIHHQEEMMQSTLKGQTQSFADLVHPGGWNSLLHEAHRAFMVGDDAKIEKIQEEIAKRINSIDDFSKNSGSYFDTAGNLLVDKDVELRSGLPASPQGFEEAKTEAGDEHALKDEAGIETEKYATGAMKQPMPERQSDRDMQNVHTNIAADFASAVIQSITKDIVEKKILPAMQGKSIEKDESGADFHSMMQEKDVVKKVAYLNTEGDRVPVGFEYAKKIPGTDQRKYVFEPFTPQQLEGVVSAPSASKAFALNKGEYLRGLYEKGGLEVL